MRNILLGALGGLILGTIGALAYSQYVSSGQLAELQAKLDAANASLAKMEQDKKDLASESSSLTAQVDELQKSNEELKHPTDAETKPAATAPAPGTDWGALAGVMRGMFRGGGFQNPQQRMLLFKARLKLTSEQTAKIQAAMDADSKARRELFQQAFQNGGSGKVDPAALAKANTLDATLASVLNPEQQRQYAQVQTDEKTARADSAATSQIDSMMPLLQLSDSQKDQVYNALYQVQMGAPDPTTLIGNPTAAATLTAQAQAMNSALAKALTPDQMTLYQQQNQANGGGQGRRGNNNTNGTNTATTSGGFGTTGAPTAGTGATTVVSTTGYTSTSNNSLSTQTVQVTPSGAVSSTVTPATPADISNLTNSSAASNPAPATTNAATSASTNAPPQ